MSTLPRFFRSYRALLRRVLPRAFARRWSDEIAWTAWCRARDARARGIAALVGFALREAGALAALVARARPPRGETRSAGDSAALVEPPDIAAAFAPEDTRPLRIAWVAALIVHFVAFALVIPIESRRLEAEAPPEPLVLRPYEPPPPPPEEPRREVRKVRTRPVPIPAPDPDRLEPIVTATEIVEAEPRERPSVDLQLAGPPSRPPQARQVYRPGPHVESPVLVHRVEPEYPELARRARLECTVILEARIGRSGEVLDVEVLRGCGLGLDEASLAAVREWRYAPTQVDGRPVEVILTVTLVYRLQ